MACELAVDAVEHGLVVDGKRGADHRGLELSETTTVIPDILRLRSP